jgi:hypothetical protein
MSKDEDVRPKAAGSDAPWTRIDVYLRSLQRRRSHSRRKLSARLSKEEEPSRLLSSSLPFVALILGLALIAFAIFSLAAPGMLSQQPKPEPKPRELGTAPPGWIDEPAPAQR